MSPFWIDPRKVSGPTQKMMAAAGLDIRLKTRVLGYVDGKSVAIDYRDAEGKYERLPQLAAELVRLGPDVLFAFGGELAPVMKKATATIPTVVVVSNDPVASGLVTSLAHPGGNVIGVTWVHDQLAGKAIGLLKEAAPSVS